MLRSFDNSFFNEQEVSAAVWIHDVKDSRFIASESYRWVLMDSIMGRVNYRTNFQTTSKGIIDDRYAFLGSYYIKNYPYFGYEKINNKIFDSGGAKIYSAYY